MAERSGNCTKYCVARKVAKLVVKLLEEIDIEQGDKERFLMLAPRAHSAIEFVIDDAAVRQAGEAVGAGLGHEISDIFRMLMQTRLDIVKALFEFGIELQRFNEQGLRASGGVVLIVF